MSFIEFLGALELGCIFALVALAVFITFRVLDFPDLTADGSFPLGGAVAAVCLVAGVNPILATAAAFGAGVLAGLVTAWLNLRWKILHLLASILTMSALYSVNLRIMGKSNIALLDEKTIFTFAQGLFTDEASGTLVVLGALLGVISLLFWRFMVSQKGLALRATGANPRMSRAQGISTQATTAFGVGLSNGMIALAGALFAQSQGFADVTMGVGTIIFGLAAVIIGEVFLPSRRMWVMVVGCLAGAFIYRLVVAFALNASDLGLQTSDLNLVTAALVAFAMMIPKLRGQKNVIGR